MECVPLADRDGDGRTLLCLLGLGYVFASVLPSALENALCWLVGGSVPVSCPMQTKKKMHIVLRFLLIYEFKLAACVFSPCAMTGFLKKNLEMVEQNSLQNASSCCQGDAW